jgi:hypothetical protein
MKTSILRGFIPTAKAPMFENADGERIQIAGDVDEVFGCSESLTLNFRGERTSASITPIRAGDRITLKRGEGMRDINETFDTDGILLTVPVRREMVSGLRGRGIPLCVDFQGTGGAYRDGRGGRAFFLATGARIAGLRLAASAAEADCTLSLID